MKKTGLLTFFMINALFAAAYLKKECYIEQRYEEKSMLQVRIATLLKKKAALEKQLHTAKNLTKIKRYAGRILNMHPITAKQRIVD